MRRWFAASTPASPIFTISANDGRQLSERRIKRSRARLTAPLASGLTNGSPASAGPPKAGSASPSRSLGSSPDDVWRDQGQVLPGDRRGGQRRDLGHLVGRGDLDHVHAPECEAAQLAQDRLGLPAGKAADL